MHYIVHNIFMAYLTVGGIEDDRMARIRALKMLLLN